MEKNGSLACCQIFFKVRPAGSLAAGMAWPTGQQDMVDQNVIQYGIQQRVRGAERGHLGG